MIYCAICSKEYVIKMLAMFQSLKPYMSDSDKLCCLCLDDEAYRILSSLKIDQLFISNVNKVRNKDIERAKNLPTGKYGDEFSAFCWAMTPWFIYYNLMTSHQDVMYIDADIVLYKGPALILKDCEGYDVGLHTHRFSSFDIRKQDVGKYNVGIVYFKNSQRGKNISCTWKEWVLTPDNKYAELYGKCGDQAYLTAFEEEFGMKYIRVFDENPDLVHGAPWCCNDLFGKEPAFYHFSHFTPDFDNDTWSSSYNGEWKPEKQKGVMALYEHYFSLLKRVKQAYSL